MNPNWMVCGSVETRQTTACMFTLHTQFTISCAWPSDSLMARCLAALLSFVRACDDSRADTHCSRANRPSPVRPKRDSTQTKPRYQTHLNCSSQRRRSSGESAASTISLLSVQTAKQCGRSSSSMDLKAGAVHGGGVRQGSPSRIACSACPHLHVHARPLCLGRVNQ